MPTPPSASPAAAADTTLLFSPDYLDLTATDSASFAINISTGRNKITGVQLEIAYDPKILSIVSLTPGTFFPTPNILLNTIDSETGRISYALVLQPSQAPLFGSGTVARLQLKQNFSGGNLSSQTTLTLLQKSLVSALGIDGSVLRETKSATINLPIYSGPQYIGTNSATPSKQ